MPAIALGLDLAAPVSRGNGDATGAVEPDRRPPGAAAPPPAVVSVLREARASPRAEAPARDPAPIERRLAASAQRGAANLSVDDPRFPVSPPAFPVQSLIVAFDRGIAAYQATQALEAAARPQLKVAAGESGVPTTA